MSEARVRPPIGRSLLALFTGFVAIVVLSTATDWAMHTTGVFPPEGQPMSDGLFVFATAYRLVYGILGAYLVARLAPDRPMRHALLSGFLGTVLTLLGVVTTWDKGPEFGPKWYPILLAVTAIPCSWLGGKLYGERSKAAA